MAEKEIQKRQVAHKVRVKDVLEGAYVKEEGMKPNYVLLKNGIQISRANIIGVIINSQNEPGSSTQTITIDDGSGKIAIRTFDANQLFENAVMGSAVNLIGKVREFGNERYITPEIITPIKKEWIAVRKLELQLKDAKDNGGAAKKQTEDMYADFEEEIVAENPYQQIMELVRKLDSGSGADTEEVILKANTDNAEKKIRTLLEEGEIYEIRPGRIKLLE